MYESNAIEMSFGQRSLVLSKLSIILSSSLAHNNSGSAVGSVNQTDASNSSTCPDPCAALGRSVQDEGVALAPLGIALVFCVFSALPVLVLRSKHRVLGIKSFLWVLVQLWVHLLATHFLFTQDRAQAYVWGLHSASHVLASWAPRRGVLDYPGLHWVATTVGASCVSLYAWQFGPAVGLAAWFRKGDALCGWSVHLVAVLGVELAQWVLSPVELLLMRI
jgi:hypothetical protein